jgi:hypothetical protein
MLQPTYSSTTPWYRRRGVLILALLVLSPFIVWGGLKELTGVGCSSGEQGVLNEFPHYSDQRIEAYSGEVSCNVRYPTKASREEVLGYYDRQLRENGWEVTEVWAANPPQGIEMAGKQLSDISEAPEEGVRSGLAARRDEPSAGRPYSYSVEYYPPGSPAVAAEGGGSEDEAMVMVSVTDEPGAGGKVGSPKKK